MLKYNHTTERKTVMKKKLFGTTPENDAVSLYTISSDGATVTVTDFGAAIVSFQVFGRDILGGFDTLDGYLNDDSHQGGTVGRVANRISGAEFEMDGKVYRLPKNNGKNCLHGGVGFDRRVWQVTEHLDDSILLEYTSSDGEEGFPAELAVRVRFTLKKTDLIIDYEAVPSGKTPISLTNHAYFNLDGLGKDIKEHVAVIYAESYTEVDDELIPTGRHPSVRGTVFDFTSAHKIGERIGREFIGYDHNFVLSPKSFKEYSGKMLGLGAEVSSGELMLRVYTDRPGLQFYIGNFLGNGPDFKGGVKQVKHGAFCLEAQTEPDCISLGEEFYGAGEVYTQTTVYSIEKM